MPTATRTELPLADVPCCTPIAGAPLGADEAADLARVLKALADPARLRLLSVIQAAEGGEACQCDLTVPVGLSQPTVSHHLKVLHDAGPGHPGEARHLGLLPRGPRPARRGRGRAHRHQDLTAGGSIVHRR